MGLFDKKYCDFCGEKIGLLGNRKLEDGNMCKDCAKKLSPFCDDRRSSTVEHIKAHLEYRERNKEALRNFTPTLVLGEHYKFYFDNNNRTFVVSDKKQGSDKWFEENPDVIPFSQVTGCGLDVDENRKEIYLRDREGNQVSYNPPKYEYSYNFKLDFTLNNPFFDDFTIPLTLYSVKDRNSLEYNKYQKLAADIMSIFGFNTGYVPVSTGFSGNIGAGINAFFNQVAANAVAQKQQNVNMLPQQNPYVHAGAQQQQTPVQQPIQQGGFCPECGSPLGGGKFCQNCGARVQ